MKSLVKIDNISFSVIKLRKTELKGDIEALLYRAGLIDSSTNEAHPERIFVSSDDERVMRRNVDPMIWLNIGPSSMLGNVIKPGYALVIAPQNEPV